MEVQMAAQAAKSTGRSTPPHHHHYGGGGAKPVPGYLRPSAGSCHHVCKYGGTHAFEEKEATKKTKHHAKPRKQPPAAVAAAPESQSRVMGKVRSVFRRRVGDSSKAAEKVAATGKGSKGGGDSVEWKDITAYDTTTVPPPHGSSAPYLPDKVTAAAQVAGSGGDAEKAKVVTGQVDGVQNQDETMHTKSAKPPKGKKPMGSLLLVEKMAAIDQELLLDGYQILSPSLMQSRVSLLRDLEKEMVVQPVYSLDEEAEEYAAAAEASRPIPAHRRVKSMSVSISSRSVRYPFARQASKNLSAGGTFKLRSRSTRAPMIAPPEEEEEGKKKLARMRSKRGGEDPSSGSTGRGIQLRIRSLRRRGVGGSSGGAGWFVVPTVTLRHQKTLEKKKSQRLYNNVIEETASKLVKTRKSRVKALVGAFESVISKMRSST
jgi:hypothetical protein